MAKKIKIVDDEELKLHEKKTKVSNKVTKNNILVVISVIILIGILAVTFLSLNDNKYNKATPGECFEVDGNAIIGYDDSCPKNVAIPEKINGKRITEIGEQAFYEKAIESVIFSTNIKKIRKEAFARNKLKKVSFPDSVEKIYSSSFMSNKIYEVTFGKNLKLIGSWAFDFNNIKNLDIPDSVTDINYEAFANNDLRKVIIGKKVSKIEYSAFGQYNWTENWHECEQNQYLKTIINKSGNSFDWYDVLAYDSYVNGSEKWLVTGTVTTKFGAINITDK